MTVFHRTLRGNAPGPRLLVLAGVHGDEYAPIEAVRRLMDTLDAGGLAGEVTFVPIANEPAFFRVSRTGPDDRDLARTFPGSVDGSVTEQIAFAVATHIRNADFLIDLHTGGLACRIAPLAGYTMHENAAIRDRQRLMAEAFNLPIVWATTPRLNGRSLSVARDAKIPAIYAEWGGGGGCERLAVDDYVQGCRNVMQVLGMVDQVRPASRIRYVVEDFRDDSGVLQKHYPAAIAGFFEPACDLMDRILIGDRLGTIHPVDFQEPQPVLARHDGIAIVLRAIPAVNQGDSLAVVLEATGPGEFRHESEPGLSAR